MLGLEAMERKKIKDKRFCYGCGSDKTYVRKNGISEWRLNPPTDLILCLHCFANLIRNPIENAIYNPRYRYVNNHRRLAFKGKYLFLKHNPRKGVCQWCGAIAGKDCIKTHMHHIQYHDDDPLKDTIELCNSCHRKEHWRLKKIGHTLMSTRS